MSIFGSEAKAAFLAAVSQAETESAEGCYAYCEREAEDGRERKALGSVVLTLADLFVREDVVFCEGRHNVITVISLSGEPAFKMVVTQGACSL